MTTQAQYAAASYKGRETASAAPRDVEGRAFMKAAMLLNDADGLAGRLRAVAFNRRLWALVQAEASSSENTLPAETKAHLLSLSFFMDKALLAFADGKGQSEVQAMIDINRSLAAAQLNRA